MPSVQQPTYIVTGGAGFVGSNLVAALLSHEPRPHVVVVDNFRSGSFANIVEACARKGAGAFDGEVIAESSAGLDWDERVGEYEPAAVFHLGAITDTTLVDEAEMLRENVQGFAAMLRACQPPARAMCQDPVPLVYASSAAVYGTPPQTAAREPFPVQAAGQPNNIYGFSKWLMEVEHRRFAEAYRAEAASPEAMDDAPAEAHVAGLRYFNVYGPGEARKGKMASMVYQLARQMIEGRRPRLFTDGSQARDQIHVDDVVDCTLAAAGLGLTGERRGAPRPGVYNLGSGVATSFKQIVEAVRSALGLSEKERATEFFEMPAAVRAFYQDYTCADMTQTRAGLGWEPRRKPMEAIASYAGFLMDGAKG
jgi:ADP-L-glycero-D-manno-heptose 6-epimerase